MIYAIQRGDDGPVKFGVSEAPRKRMNELQIGSAEKLLLQAFADLPKQFEVLIHHFCRADRMGGEWFRPSKRVLELIEVIRRQALFPREHVVTNYIYEQDLDSIKWHRKRIGLRVSFPEDYDRSQEKREMMEDIIQTDPLIRDFVKHFGATVVKGSTRHIPETRVVPALPPVALELSEDPDAPQF